MSNIHTTAIVDKSAVLGDNVTIEPHAIVEADAKIGNNVIVGSNCLVARYTELMDNVKLFHGAVLGTVPQDLKFRDEKTRLVIGENTVIREYAMLSRGTSHSGETVVGKNCLLMAYTHLAHDCYIGNNVILANAVNVAGHVEIGDFVTIGGVVPIHQFVKIGAHCMIGGGFRVQQDVCPYSLVGGYPLKVVGLNTIGLRRRGFSKETVQVLEKVFKLLFFSQLNTTQAVEKITKEVEQTEEVKIILEFIKNSSRGMVK
ncbi:MAG: acyl-[acyl-carrier-protein]--UDP-N-acetylglucosamine O-acyltransferase [candidate division Zixibacteria bacterium HGW-Zixibacteria-1]|nr:MAG: acyl-[acyl-carrier-protein]--UDP-N-acetylglucosamine O-acyltransferase [candidate division Zixibacteria bacterium HGW-Zixibacteria-1]